MFDKEEIQVLRQLFADQKFEIRDEMRSCISASETRMMGKMQEMKEEIIDGITDVLDYSVLPRLDEHDREIRRIKHHLKLA